MAQQIHVADYQAEGAHEVNGAQSRPTAAPATQPLGRPQPGLHTFRSAALEPRDQASYRCRAVERFRVGEELKLVSIGETSFIACADCGHLLCDAASNYKLSAARIDGSLHEIDPELFPDPATELDDKITYRQYLYPRCGVLFDNELAKSEDPPLWDVQLE